MHNRQSDGGKPERRTQQSGNKTMFAEGLHTGVITQGVVNVFPKKVAILDAYE